MDEKLTFIRNIALIAHESAGKTTLAEAMLFSAKATERLGNVDQGTSILDYEPEEIKRRMTISSAFHHYTWADHKVNIIDTPGNDNFLSDTIITLQGADGAIVVIDATEGMKFQTEEIFSFVDKFKLPFLIFVSKMDKEKANFYEVLKEMNEILNKKMTPICLPIGAGSNFCGIINLLTLEAWTYQKDGSGKFSKVQISADLKEKTEKYTENLMENLAEVDDTLLEKYLEGKKIEHGEWLKALHQGSIDRTIVPIICGSGKENIGIHLLLDMVNHCLPSPIEKAGAEGHHPHTNQAIKYKPDINEPLSALVIKTISDPFAGRINIFRVFSGKLSSNSTILNATKGYREKVGQLFAPAGKSQRILEEVKAGDIAAVAKLKATLTGDTLCDEKNPILFSSITPFPPIISFAIEPASAGDEEKIYASLVKLSEEDPALKLERNIQTKELIASGTGRSHLENTIEKLKRKYGVEVNIEKPKVPYKETIKGKARAQGKYKKQTGGRGQYGDAWIEIEPLPRGSGFEFIDRIVGGVIPKNYIPAVEKGIVEAMQAGVLAGFPVIDLKVHLVDGSYHPVDSSDIAFKIAGSMAFKKGFMKAKPILLEPIMKLIITVPEEWMGNVIGDLNGRRGKVLGVDARAKYQIIKALVPMAEVLTYASDLVSITGGNSSFNIEFSHYEEVPVPLAEKIVEQAKQERTER